MRALIIGHFSTVGDIESLEFVKRVLDEERVDFDIAPYKAKFVPLIKGSLPAKSVDPARYTHLVAVCGPFWPQFLANHGIDLNRFSHCVRIGVNLTMVLPLDQWNPFHVLIERDSASMVRPDLTFLEDSGSVPVVGLCTIARQREYGERQRHAEALRLFRELLDSRGVAAIEIDTRWPEARNSGALGSPAEVISVIRRTDVMLTNRLHGMVYALKAGVPALALDPVAGGGKVLAQAKVLGWPAASTVDQGSPDWLRETFDWCLSGDGKDAARAIAGKARGLLNGVPEELRMALHKSFDHRPIPKPASGKTGVARRFAKALRFRN